MLRTPSRICALIFLAGISLSFTAAISDRSVDSTSLSNFNTNTTTTSSASINAEASYCTDLSAVYNESCWGILGLTEWLSNWSAPACDANQDGIGCCTHADNWSTCFLRLAKGQDGYNCSEINNGFCTFNPSLDPSLDPSIVHQVHYVVKNIFTIATLFSDWFTAIQYATTQASLIIQSIVTVIDPKKKTNLILDDILTALSAGLAFIGFPEIGAAAEAASVVTEAATVVGKALVTGLQQAPGVAQAIWPTGTSDSQSIQIGDLDTTFGNASTTISDKINAGLTVLMTNATAFAAFASSGTFSGDTTLSIPNDVDSLTLALKTHISSVALKSNNFRGSVYSGDQNPWLCSYFNGTLYWSLDCNATKTDCNPSTLEIGNKSFFCIKNKYNEVVTNQWAVPELLFKGAWNCAGAGFWGQDPVNFADDGSINMDCMSQISECVFVGHYPGTVPYCPTDLVNGGCPMQKC